ncbi:MAG TPA: ABC transporter permease [Firmicutes bacterium]|jgi:ribose transport system permease protein|nr:ABC transporter permease [Bacillota bacterium]
MKNNSKLKGQLKSLIIYIGLLLICIVFAILNPTFISPSNLMTILSHMAPLALMSFGLASVMMAGDFDLSLVGITGFSAVTIIVLANQFNLLVGLLGGLIVAVLVGFLNGFFVVKVGIHPWLATIAMMRMTFGLEQILSKGYAQNLNHPFIYWLGHSRIGFIPAQTIFALLIFGVMYVLIQKHKFGYHLYALGGNRIAAQIAGIRVQKPRILAYMLAGVLCFFASICLTGTLSGYTPLATEKMVNDTILAVFIGSSVSKRKVINIPGTFLGVIIMGIFSNGLALIGVPSYWMQLVKGILIILVIVTSSRSEKMVQI